MSTDVPKQAGRSKQRPYDVNGPKQAGRARWGAVSGGRYVGARGGCSHGSPSHAEASGFSRSEAQRTGLVELYSLILPSSSSFRMTRST